MQSVWSNGTSPWMDSQMQNESMVSLLADNWNATLYNYTFSDNNGTITNISETQTSSSAATTTTTTTTTTTSTETTTRISSLSTSTASLEGNFSLEVSSTNAAVSLLESLFAMEENNSSGTNWTRSSSQTSNWSRVTNGSVLERECDPNGLEWCLPHVSPLSVAEIVQIVTLSILFLLSFTGNMVALIKITRNTGQLRHSIYQLMLHLIVADLFVTFFCLFGDAIHKITVNWYADDVTCKLYKLLGSFSQFLSSYIVALVGVNRAMVVIKPMLSPSRMKRIMQYLITAVWIFSLLMSIPQLIIWSKVRGPFIEEFYDCTTIGHNWTDVEAMLHACVISSFIFIVPLIIMAVSYILVIRTLSKTTADQMLDIQLPRARTTSTLVVPSQHEADSSANLSQPARYTSYNSSNCAARSTFYSRAKQRSQRMSLQISIWYTACWLPYIVVFIAMAILKNESILQELSRWCIFFGQTNSIINPIIYASFHISKNNVSKKSANRLMAVKMAMHQSASHDCIRSSTSNEQFYTAMRDTCSTRHNSETTGQQETEIDLDKLTT